MHAKFRSPVPKPLGLLAALFMALPLLLAACGGGTAATNTPQAKATTAPSAAATTAPTAAAAATQPAASAVATTAPSGSAATTAPSGSAAAGSATIPAAAPAIANLTLPPDSKRGAGGTLKLLWWQAPTILNSQIAQGTKDYDASRLVEEPLATLTNAAVTPDVPVLAKEIPSVQNGELAADGTSVTWKLKDGVVWSDGQPFTADDVVFTWKWEVDPKNGGTNTTQYDFIQDATAVNPTTVKLTFKAPTPVWYLPFVGSAGAVLPQHILKDCPVATQCPYNQKPIGTGPYVVTDFISGDHVSYVANDKFREPNAPWYAKVDLKGGGDAPTAVKAVQTGQVDYAWNPQVAPEILKQLTDSGNTLEIINGASVEKIYVNFSDPSIEVNGEKSSVKSSAGTHRTSLLVHGIFSIILGILIWAWPGLTALAALYFIAIWAIIIGVTQIVSAVQLRREIASEWFLGIGGALSVLFGIICFIHPASGVLALIWLIGIYAILFGVTLIGLGLRLRNMGGTLGAAQMV